MLVGWQIRHQNKRHADLAAFAADNDMSFQRAAPYDSRKGLIFQDGSEKLFSQLITAKDRLFSEVGNFWFSSNDGYTYQSGFIRIPLQRSLPHIILDSKKNNPSRLNNKTARRYPFKIKRGQKMQLEGDFNNYYDLYVPGGYQTDALYIFTPDVMQALIDDAQDFDCEIIDSSLYLYAPGGFDLFQKDFYERLHTIVSKLNPELIKQTSFYAYHRVDPGSKAAIASQGAELRKSFMPRSSALIFVIFALAILAVVAVIFDLQ